MVLVAMADVTLIETVTEGVIVRADEVTAEEDTRVAEKAEAIDTVVVTATSIR